MVTLHKADVASMRSDLVVKHTFLEYRSGADSHQGCREDVSFSQLRSSSDSCLYERGSFPEPIKEIGHGEDFRLAGFSDDDQQAPETESTSTSACGENASEPETLEATADSRSDSGDQLSSENARLREENQLLRKQCLEVALAAQSAAAASTSMAISRLESDTGCCNSHSSDPAPMLMQQHNMQAQGQQASPPMSEYSNSFPNSSAGAQMAFMPAMRPDGGGAMFAPKFQMIDMGQCFWVPVNCCAGESQVMQTTGSMAPAAMDGDMHSKAHRASTLPGAPRDKQQNQQISREEGGRHGGGGMQGKHRFVEQDLSAPCSHPDCSPTTVMLRNLPNNYSRDMLLDLIDSEGFAQMYDFIYLPVDFKTRASLGYAFVNMANFEVANRFRLTFDGYSSWILPSRKVCGVSWSTPHQGLESHIERYRNSPVMHEGVPDMYKPVLFKDGIRVEFPPPTKKIRAPRIRHFHGAGCIFPSTATTPNEARLNNMMMG